MKKRTFVLFNNGKRAEVDSVFSGIRQFRNDSNIEKVVSEVYVDETLATSYIVAERA